MSRGALGGGTWVTQNKILPGSYINFVSVAKAIGQMGDRGIVAAALELDYGSDEVITIDNKELQTEALNIFGYNFTHESLRPLRELSRGAKEMKIYRLNSLGSTPAEANIGDLNIKARYPGIRGNDIQISIQQNIDNESEFEVITYLDSIERDYQLISSLNDLKDNDFVIFNGNGDIEESAGIKLKGGKNGEVTGESHAKFLDLIEREDFTTLVYPGEDEVTKLLYDSFTKRLRDEEGIKVTCVLYDYSKSDFEGTISVFNQPELAYWVAGKTAGANFNESLTNDLYDGEYKVNTQFKKRQFKQALTNGHFVFYQDGDDVRVLDDINTFTSFTPYKRRDFADNRVIRVLDQIGNDTAIIFNKYYLGKVDNESTGRDLFKSELVKHREELEQLKAITEFDYDDINIFKGDEKDHIRVEERVQPVGVMKKLYMNVKVI